MSQFRELFRLSVAHTYYDSVCRDFEFLIPSDTVELLKQGKFLTKVADNTLYVLYEADELGAPLVNAAGTPLRIALRTTNPYFSNFTNVAQDYYSKIAVYYMADTDQLLSSGTFPLVAPVFSHTITDSARPVTVSFTHSTGTIVEETITEASITTIGLDAGPRPAGTYTVREIFPTTTVDTAYYVDSELYQQRAVVLFDFPLEGDLYSDANDFEIPFQAKEETIRYHVVVKNYSNDDILALTVTDNGYSEDDRPQLAFTKVIAGNPGYDGLDVNLLKSGDETVILFKSGANVPRRAAGRKKIQLIKGTEVLITNLPQPGPDKADAHMIIHLSKP